VVTDEELVARARGQDFAAFEELVERYEDKIFRLAYRFVRNETEAKEILQDTFLSVWRKLDTFKGDSQFGSWLYRVATNTALMRLRAQRSCRSTTSTTTDTCRPPVKTGPSGPTTSFSRTSCAAASRPRSMSCRRSTGRSSSSVTSRGCRPKRPPRCSRSPSPR
jgi:RNA polymerase sigma factor (sigma-70 family)